MGSPRPPARPARPSGPLSRRARRPSPTTGAVSTCSIFIASTTSSGVPASTSSPTAACTTVTVPGIGEVTTPSAAAPAPADDSRSCSRRAATWPSAASQTVPPSCWRKYDMVRPSRLDRQPAAVPERAGRHRARRPRPGPPRRRSGRAAAPRPAPPPCAWSRRTVHAGSPSRQPSGTSHAVDDGAGRARLDQQRQRRGGEHVRRRGLGSRSGRRRGARSARCRARRRPRRGRSAARAGTPAFVVTPRTAVSRERPDAAGAGRSRGRGPRR